MLYYINKWIKSALSNEKPIASQQMMTHMNPTLFIVRIALISNYSLSQRWERRILSLRIMNSYIPLWLVWLYTHILKYFKELCKILGKREKTLWNFHKSPFQWQSYDLFAPVNLAVISCSVPQTWCYQPYAKYAIKLQTTCFWIEKGTKEAATSFSSICLFYHLTSCVVCVWG